MSAFLPFFLTAACRSEKTARSDPSIQSYLCLWRPWWSHNSQIIPIWEPVCDSGSKGWLLPWRGSVKAALSQAGESSSLTTQAWGTMSTTDLKCAEVPVEEYRNCWLVLLTHGSPQSKGQKLFSLLFCPFFPVCAGLQGRLLSHRHHAELVPHLTIPGASQCQGKMLVIAWHVLK